MGFGGWEHPHEPRAGRPTLVRRLSLEGRFVLTTAAMRMRGGTSWLVWVVALSGCALQKADKSESDGGQRLASPRARAAPRPRFSRPPTSPARAVARKMRSRRRTCVRRSTCALVFPSITASFPIVASARAGGDSTSPVGATVTSARWAHRRRAPTPTPSFEA